jgi:hypothetical protein
MQASKPRPTASNRYAIASARKSATFRELSPMHDRRFLALLALVFSILLNAAGWKARKLPAVAEVLFLDYLYRTYRELADKPKRLGEFEQINVHLTVQFLCLPSRKCCIDHLSWQRLSGHTPRLSLRVNAK